LNLDGASWQELYQRACARMAQLVPGWSDAIPSDPAVALLELTSYLVTVQNREIDRLREEHYTAYLKLLGEAPQTLTPARLMAVPEGDGAIWPGMQFLYHSNNSAVARDQRGFVVIVEDEAIQNGGANGPQVLPRSEISELLEDLYRKIETGKSRGSGACYDHKTNILTYNSNDPQLIDYPDLLSNWGASVDKVPQFIYFQYPLVSVLMHEFGHRKQALEGLDFTLIQRSPLLIVLAEYDNVIRHENLLEGRCRRKYGANEVDNQQKPDPAYACLIQRTEYFLIQKILRFLNENVYKGDSKALGTVKTILENLQEEPPAKKFLKINMWNKFCELYHISSF